LGIFLASGKFERRIRKPIMGIEWPKKKGDVGKTLEQQEVRLWKVRPRQHWRRGPQSQKREIKKRGKRDSSVRIGHTKEGGQESRKF